MKEENAIGEKLQQHNLQFGKNQTNITYLFFGPSYLQFGKIQFAICTNTVSSGQWVVEYCSQFWHYTIYL